MSAPPDREALIAEHIKLVEGYADAYYSDTLGHFPEGASRPRRTAVEASARRLAQLPEAQPIAPAACCQQFVTCRERCVPLIDALRDRAVRAEDCVRVYDKRIVALGCIAMKSVHRSSLPKSCKERGFSCPPITHPEEQPSLASTHADGCHTWGRGHYECALTRIASLEAENTALRAHPESWRTV